MHDAVYASEEREGERKQSNCSRKNLHLVLQVALLPFKINLNLVISQIEDIFGFTEFALVVLKFGTISWHIDTKQQCR